MANCNFRHKTVYINELPVDVSGVDCSAATPGYFDPSVVCKALEIWNCDASY